MVRWYNPIWREPAIPTNKYDKATLRTAFEKSVKRRMMSDVPWGVLLSGGLDSSLVAAVASRMVREQEPEVGDDHSSFNGKLHSFCVLLDIQP